MNEAPCILDGLPMTDAGQRANHSCELTGYRNADVRTYGKALKLLPNWTTLSKCRRQGSQAMWFYRLEDGPRDCRQIETESFRSSPLRGCCAPTHIDARVFNLFPLISYY